VPQWRSGRSVAVVGSGPAGLAAAAQLNQAGHWVTLYERQDRIGGLLRYGVPDFKLEKWIVQRRVDILAAEGVEFVTGVEVGRDIDARDLHDRFDAVVIATGSTVPRDLPVPGRELDGVHFAMDYLEQRNRYVAGDYPPERPISASGRHVIIIGGGDTGADCLGNSHRELPRSVTQLELLLEPPAERPDDKTPWPNWPLILRTSPAHEEGGERVFGAMTTHLSGENGRVTTLHGHHVGPPPTFEKIEGSEFELPADLILLAMGFLHPEHQGLVEQLAVALDERGNVRASDEEWATSVPGVFACGDARRGQSLIVWAISEGRQCADAVDRYLAELDGDGAADTEGVAPALAAS
jgi:glutamate synthase (NADPH/NADH) small chain